MSSMKALVALLVHERCLQLMCANSLWYAKDGGEKLLTKLYYYALTANLLEFNSDSIRES